ncbi:multifunctional CCA addition/repair protein [Morganella morganii]|uniref:multifunctional CCA addition/repair protein n=1 Tax=Morganella morganii TaxID=582 RepID=UPI00069A996E|nr:multifunctional CCA addition/repair protein [Morganella morganii]KNZ89412.1 tRNA nucleotidyl transferase [Morganella morganii]MBS9543255.1 multifunctional CCA addition/repair protein [Morganella morganii subsp. morganii]MDF2407089.1 multifunctional CCA addition/repair protein [Morganella morganii]HCR4032083.1 multifunctional CCA addition/repair protein [Morganella morganii]
MDIYLVGGAVRDALLGLPVSDRDWVVVGATPDIMLERGYQQVGRDFPVFLHPGTREEYALARTERKTGAGYTGFACYSAPDVTLEDDLQRRDLTINAMAQSADGTLYDPYHGADDLKNRILRHVSEAFTEDPLRVLRVARFAARFAPQGFVIAPETLELMSAITQQGELAHLTAERVWKETEKALSSPCPDIYFSVLRRCGALAVLFPELETLFCATDGQTGYDILTAGLLRRTVLLTNSTDIRFAALCLYLSCHSGGEGTSAIQQLSERLRVPNPARDLALLATCHYRTVHDIGQLTADDIIALFDSLDAWRKPERITQLAVLCEADYRSRIAPEATDYPQGHILAEAFTLAQNVAVKPVIEAGFKGADIKAELTRRRAETVGEWQQKSRSS